MKQHPLYIVILLVLLFVVVSAEERCEVHNVCVKAKQECFSGEYEDKEVCKVWEKDANDDVVCKEHTTIKKCRNPAIQCLKHAMQKFCFEISHTNSLQGPDTCPKDEQMYFEKVGENILQRTCGPLKYNVKDKNVCNIFLDPHLSLNKKRMKDFHHNGDFTMFRSADGSFEVHARMRAYVAGRAWTGIYGIAVLVNGKDIVEYILGEDPLINKKPVKLQNKVPVEIPNGGSIMMNNKVFLVFTPNNGEVAFTNAGVRGNGASQGLAGNLVITLPKAISFTGVCTGSEYNYWESKRASGLFSKTYIEKLIPIGEPVPITPEKKEEAKKLCTIKGIPKERMEECIFDVINSEPGDEEQSVDDELDDLKLEEIIRTIHPTLPSKLTTQLKEKSHENESCKVVKIKKEESEREITQKESIAQELQELMSKLKEVVLKEQDECVPIQSQAIKTEEQSDDTGVSVLSNNECTDITQEVENLKIVQEERKNIYESVERLKGQLDACESVVSYHTPFCQELKTDKDALSGEIELIKSILKLVSEMNNEEEKEIITEKLKNLKQRLKDLLAKEDTECKGPRDPQRCKTPQDSVNHLESEIQQKKLQLTKIDSKIVEIQEILQTNQNCEESKPVPIRENFLVGGGRPIEIDIKKEKYESEIEELERREKEECVPVPSDACIHVKKEKEDLLSEIKLVKQIMIKVSKLKESSEKQNLQNTLEKLLAKLNSIEEDEVRECQRNSYTVSAVCKAIQIRKQEIIQKKTTTITKKTFHTGSTWNQQTSSSTNTEKSNIRQETTPVYSVMCQETRKEKQDVIESIKEKEQSKQELEIKLVQITSEIESLEKECGPKFPYYTHLRVNNLTIGDSFSLISFGDEPYVKLLKPDGSDFANGGIAAKKLWSKRQFTEILQLGEKWRLSGIGDKNANDDWLRLMDADGKNYRGGLAAKGMWNWEMFGHIIHLGKKWRLSGSGDGMKNDEWLRLTDARGKKLYGGFQAEKLKTSFLHADTLQLGKKWLLSGVGDKHADDTWLRFFNKEGTSYYGGIAANTFWTGTNYQTSDEREKENIQTLDKTLSKLEQMRGVSYDWKDSKKKDIGVIAQEVEKVFPQLVSDKGPNKNRKGVNYSAFTGIFIEAIKELKQEADQLKSELEEAKALVSELKTKMPQKKQ